MANGNVAQEGSAEIDVLDELEKAQDALERASEHLSQLGAIIASAKKSPSSADLLEAAHYLSENYSDINAGISERLQEKIEAFKQRGMSS